MHNDCKLEIKALKESSSVSEAAERLGITNDALRKRFGRSAIALKPEGYLKADPVETVKTQRNEKQLTSVNKELVALLEVERAKNDFLKNLGKPQKRLAIPKREKSSGIREMTALVLASDWHVEEEVNPVKLQGRNKFSLDIAKLRIDRFFHGVVDLVTHHRASGKIAIRDLVLWFGGDFITGHIHEEMMMTSQLAPVETVLWLYPYLKAGLQYLLKELDLESIVIPCDVGNHGRTTKFRHITTGPETSYEYGMYCQLARDFADEPRIRFDTAAANDHYVEIYDYVLHTTHGDSVRYGGGVGGLTVPLLKAVSSWDTDTFADWHAIGHFHTALDIDKAIANGCLVGWNPFAKWIKARYNERDLSQHFSLIDKDRGRCHSTPIWVRKLGDELKYWTKEEKKLL